MSLLKEEDFTLYQSGGKLMSGGFEINSVGGTQEGVGSDVLKNLAVPLYYFYKGGSKKKYHNYAESEIEDSPVIDDNLYDKLLNMMEYKEEKNDENKKEDDERKNIKKNKKRGTKKHFDNKKLKPHKKSKKNK